MGRWRKPKPGARLENDDAAAKQEMARLHADLEKERRHCDHLAKVLTIVKRDWCPDACMVPAIDEHNARRAAENGDPTK